MTISTNPPIHTPRHRTDRPDSPRRLALKWLLTLRWHLLALFLSDLGRSMIARKYDAFTTDNGYSDQPKGWGVARLIDGVVRKRDTHVALRQRLEIVTSELVETSLAKRGKDPVRLVSGPVGLGRDVRQAWNRLESLGSSPSAWLEVIGVDLDASDEVLDEASRLAEQEQIPLQTYKQDLLDPQGLIDSIGGPADVFNSIGLTTWLDSSALDRLLASIVLALEPGGSLIIDHWRRHRGSKYVDTLQMPARYLTDYEFERALRRAGFTIDQKRVTPNRVAVVYRVSPQG